MADKFPVKCCKIRVSGANGPISQSELEALAGSLFNAGKSARAIQHMFVVVTFRWLKGVPILINQLRIMVISLSRVHATEIRRAHHLCDSWLQVSVIGFVELTIEKQRDFRFQHTSELNTVNVLMWYNIAFEKIKMLCSSLFFPSASTYHNLFSVLWSSWRISHQTCRGETCDKLHSFFLLSCFSIGSIQVSLARKSQSCSANLLQRSKWLVVCF